MCLNVNIDDTNNFIKRNKNKKEIIVWKVLDKIDCSTYVTPYMGCNVKLNSYFSAENPLPRYTITNYTETIHDGAIHVFLTRKQARLECGSTEEVTIRCIAKISNFIACNYEDNEACFTKIKIGKNEKG